MMTKGSSEVAASVDEGIMRLCDASSKGGDGCTRTAPPLPLNSVPSAVTARGLGNDCTTFSGGCASLSGASRAEGNEFTAFFATKLILMFHASALVPTKLSVGAGANRARGSLMY